MFIILIPMMEMIKMVEMVEPIIISHKDCATLGSKQEG